MERMTIDLFRYRGKQADMVALAIKFSATAEIAIAAIAAMALIKWSFF